jgi:hypothetical protein
MFVNIPSTSLVQEKKLAEKKKREEYCSGCFAA